MITIPIYNKFNPDMQSLMVSLVLELLPHFLVLLVEHLLDLVHEILSVDGDDLREFLHEVDHVRERQALAVDYLVHLDRRKIFQLVEGLLVGLIEFEIHVFLDHLLLVQDIREAVFDAVHAHVGSQLFLGQDDHHYLGDL